MKPKFQATLKRL